MAETYFIFLKDTSKGTRCLDVGSDGVSVQANAFLVSSQTQNWKLYPAPGYERQGGCYLLNLAQQKFAAFGKNPIQLVTFNIKSIETFLLLQSVGNGWVAINNHNASSVMDTNMGSSNLAVNPYPWHEGDNQNWRLVNAGIPFSAT